MKSSPPNRVTNVDRQTDPIKSQWGPVQYLDWCRLEAQRMLNLGVDVYVWTSGNLCCICKKDGQ